MNQVYLIGDDFVKAALDMLEIIEAVTKAYALKAQGLATLFPVITHVWQQDTKDMDIKAGEIGGDFGIFGLKALTYMAANDQLGLPRLNGTMLLFDANNGQLQAVLDSRSMTGMRTGAAGAIGSKFLARPEAQTLTIVGSGNQAFYNLAGQILLCPQLTQVYIYDPKGYNLALAFAAQFKARFSSDILSKYQGTPMAGELQTKLHCPITATNNLAQAAAASDIITTTTPAREPLLELGWLKPGVHINCIGADMEGKQEIAANILPQAQIFVDDLNQAQSIGECQTACRQGLIAAADLTEIGAVINQTKPGRQNAQAITLFDTSGLALQDLVVANLVIAKAKAGGLPQYSF